MIPRCRLVVPANNQSNVKSEADYVPLSQHYDEKQEGMTAAFDGNPPQLHAEEEHKSGTTTERMIFFNVNLILAIAAASAATPCSKTMEYSIRASYKLSFTGFKPIINR